MPHPIITNNGKTHRQICVEDPTAMPGMCLAENRQIEDVLNVKGDQQKNSQNLYERKGECVKRSVCCHKGGGYDDDADSDITYRQVAFVFVSSGDT